MAEPYFKRIEGEIGMKLLQHSTGHVLLITRRDWGQGPFFGWWSTILNSEDHREYLLPWNLPSSEYDILPPSK